MDATHILTHILTHVRTSGNPRHKTSVYRNVRVLRRADLPVESSRPAPPPARQAYRRAVAIRRHCARGKAFWSAVRT